MLRPSLHKKPSLSRTQYFAVNNTKKIAVFVGTIFTTMQLTVQYCTVHEPTTRNTVNKYNMYMWYQRVGEFLPINLSLI